MEPTRVLSVLSFCAVLLLVRRSLALTPLIHRKRSPFPPSGEGLVGDCYLWRDACREPSPLKGKAWWWVATSSVAGVGCLYP